MLHGNYGQIVYSVSTDGLHWTLLNQGKPILDDYRGHPDICRGPDAHPVAGWHALVRLL
jgi:hypothetical protein